MDQAGEELGRIIAFVNRRPWIMEDNSGCGLGSSQEQSLASKSNYFLDRLGVTAFGDSSLHRVCAWHTTPDQFHAFLSHMEAHRFAKEHSNHDTIMSNNNAYNDDGDGILQDLTPTMTHDNLHIKSCPAHSQDDGGYRDMPDPPRLDQANHRGVTALHVAVYRNAFYAHQIVKQLIQQQPSLSSTPMTSCGSYPLHILCGQNVTIRKEVLVAVLQADPNAVWKEDINGDTPLSLLWKNVLRFRWAQQDHIVLQDEEEEDDDLSSDSDSSGMSGSSRVRRQRRRPSWMTVISPDQYLEYSLLLIRAALGKDDNQHLQLGDVCRMPRCPPLLIQLLLQYPNKFVMVSQYDTDSHGMTPLHHAAHVNAVTPQFVPVNVLHQMNRSSVIDLLLKAFPTMACIKDRRGRIPLHYVLEKSFPHNNNMNIVVDGTSVSDEKEALYRVVQANPDSLGIQDPVTGLYPFALLASQPSQQKEQQSEDSMDIDMDMTTCFMNEKDMAHLETIMVLLRQFPDAAIYRES